MPLPVILHPDVTDFLRTTEFQNDLKGSIWKCIDKLREQNIDGGLRVKKLRGSPKKVWEARITKAIRLIFTYEKSIHPDTRKPQVYVAIQDICLDHDDVLRRAKARKRTPDAQWLDAEEIRVIGNLETDCDNLSEDEQSAILEAIDEELQILENIADELLGNIQWQVLESASEWHKAIIELDEDLPLRLSLEESDVINCDGNLLLSGSAGTGKTTVGLYRLLKNLETLPPGKRLYVAYNPILVKETNKQFKRLVGTKLAKFESWFQFDTIRDLCSQMSPQIGENYLEYDEVDYQVFERLYRRNSDSKKYPPALVWDEIRSIIKGSCLQTDARLLSLEEYEDLGRRRSSVVAKGERSKIYKIAQWYQNHLKEKRFDEIDLAREALKYIKQGKREPYQMIVCDEVQDLTELQLHLLMQLITPNGHLFFAGDLNQMISPSGFRWKDLKTQFHNSKLKVTEKKLHFNFRSVGSLVQLANQLLKLRSRLLKEKIDQSHNKCDKNEQLDKSTRLIDAALDNLEPTLKQLYSADAILVRTQEQKEKLRTQFNSSLVFTIEEAKGLEFDTVFLVEFFLPHQDLWQKAIKGIPVLKDKEIPQLRLELNLLYVAITRARRILNVWETQLSAIWNQEELVDLVQQITPESVIKERFESTVQMWQERGLYYLEAKRYRQALECFENSGDVKLEWQASAKLFLQEGEYSKATEFFIKLEDWLQAARLLEKEKQWSQAALYWSKAGNTNQQQLCEIYALENENKWEGAAQRWEELGRLEDGRRCWLKSDNEPKKVEIRVTRAKQFEAKQQWLDASEQYRLARIPKKAAVCKAKQFETKKQWEKAAEQYELAEMPEKAQDCRNEWGIYLFKHQKYSEAAELFIKLGDWQQAAQSFEKEKQWSQAALYWSKAGNTNQQQLCEIYALENENKWEGAAQRWEELGRLEDGRRCWLNSSNEEKKAEIKAIQLEIHRNDVYINNCIDLATRTKLKEVRALCLNSAHMLKQANECPEFELSEACSQYIWNKCFWLVYNSGGRVKQDQDYAINPLEIPKLVNEISSCLTEIETELEAKNFT